MKKMSIVIYTVICLFLGGLMFHGFSLESGRVTCSVSNF